MALRSHGKDHNGTATTKVIKHTIERTQGCVCTEIKGGWLIPPAHASGKCTVLERPKTDLRWSHILQACLDRDCPCLGVSIILNISREHSGMFTALLSDALWARERVSRNWSLGQGVIPPPAGETWV